MDPVEERDADAVSETYPLQIPMDHSPSVQLDQAPRGPSQLHRLQSFQCRERKQGTVRKTHKGEPVRAPMGLHELIYIPICHPFRHHRELELRPVLRNPQERYHIWMVECLPGYDFLVKPLHTVSTSSGKVRLQVTSQHLDCDLLSAVLPLQYICEPAVTAWGVC